MSDNTMCRAVQLLDNKFHRNSQVFLNIFAKELCLETILFCQKSKNIFYFYNIFCKYGDLIAMRDKTKGI